MAGRAGRIDLEGGAWRPARRDGGALLLVVVAVLALLTLLGLAFALIAQDENSIAVNYIRGNQALYVAEGTARCVRGWFEEPDPAFNPLVPAPSQVNRSLREVDPDGNGVFSHYAVEPPPWNVIYRQGTDDLFERPYRGSPSLSLEGSARGPDVRISRAGSASEQAFLDLLADRLFPGFPSERERARISRIDIFAPPVHRIGGRPVRFGVATIEVTVSLLTDYTLPGQREVATRSVRAVLTDPPYRKARGPLLTAGDIDLRSGLEARWGIVAARRDIWIPSPSSPAVPSGWPRRAPARPILPDEDGDGTAEDTDADGTSDWNEWWASPDDTLEDPWFFASAGRSLVPASSSSSPDELPWPFDPADLPAGPGGPYDPDADRSDLLQNASFDPVPDLDYDLWKMAARTGFGGHHYYSFDPSSGGWREEGSSAAVSVDQATRGRQGLFFFDTVDGQAPADADGDGTADNLAPPVVLGSGWWSAGVLFVGASSLRFDGIGWQGRVRRVGPPGEPCADRNGNGHCDAAEPFLQLQYPSDPLAPGASFRRLALTTPAAGAVRQLSGPVTDIALAFEGLLIVAGDLRAGGDANLFGSALAGRSASTQPSSPPQGLLRLLADPLLPLGLSPSRESGAPRTVVVSWEVERKAASLPSP